MVFIDVVSVGRRSAFVIFRKEKIIEILFDGYNGTEGIEGFEWWICGFKIVFNSSFDKIQRVIFLQVQIQSNFV